jgi:membrane protease YdiL (CAAX protease family)
MTNKFGFFQQSVVFEGSLAIVALLFSLLFGLNLWDGAEFNLTTLQQMIAATLPLILIYFCLKILPFESLKKVDVLVRDLFRQHMQHLLLWQFALISLAAGFGEELLFRGLLQSGLLHWFDGNIYQMTAVIFSVSLLFGAAHAITKMYFFLTFIVSVYFGVIQILTGNILVPIAVHAFYDFFVFMFVKMTLDVPMTKENF